MKKTKILGCGLISIGRMWGNMPKVIPSLDEVIEYLGYAFSQGITFFDTAPSYGSSEERFGIFLNTLNHEQRSQLFIATKCGEEWNKRKDEPFIDMSYEGLCKSINKSIKHLGRINLLQIHRATPNVLQDDNVHKAISYAKQLGIDEFGISTSDFNTAKIALTDDRFTYIQIPYNMTNPYMKEIILKAKKYNKKIIINRPFAMGKMIDIDYENKDELIKKAFHFIIDENFSGVVLTGTSNIEHLKENIKGFKECL